MAVCPYCGLAPTVLTEDTETGSPFYQCENAHLWQELGDGGEYEGAP